MIEFTCSNLGQCRAFYTGVQPEIVLLMRIYSVALRLSETESNQGNEDFSPCAPGAAKSNGRRNGRPSATRGSAAKKLLNRGLHLLHVEGVSLPKILEIKVMLDRRACHCLVVHGDAGLRAERLDPGVAEVDLGDTAPRPAGLILYLDRLGAREDH